MAIKSLKGINPVAIGLQHLLRSLENTGKTNITPLQLLNLYEKRQKRMEQQEDRQRKIAKEEKATSATDMLLSTTDWPEWKKEIWRNTPEGQRGKLLEAWTEPRSLLGKLFHGPAPHPLAPKQGFSYSPEQQQQIIESLKAEGIPEQEIPQILATIQENMQGAPDEGFSAKRAFAGSLPEIMGGLGTRALYNTNPALLAPSLYQTGADIVNAISNYAGGPQQVAPNVSNIQSLLGNILQYPQSVQEQLGAQLPAQLEGSPWANLASGDIFASPKTLGLLGESIKKVPLTVQDATRQAREAIQQGIDIEPRNYWERKIQDFSGLAAALTDPKKLVEGGFKGAASVLYPALKRAGTAHGVGWLAKTATGSELSDHIFTNAALLSSHFMPDHLENYKNALYKKFNEGIKEGKKATTSIPREIVQDDIKSLSDKAQLGDPHSPRKDFLNKRLVEGIENAIPKETIQVEHPISASRGNINDMLDLREEFNSPKIRKEAKNLSAGKELKEAKNILDKAINWWGEHTKSEDLIKTYREANSINQALKDNKLMSSQIKSWVRKPGGLSGIAARLATNLFIDKVEAAQRILKYPAVRDYYLKGWQEAFRKDFTAFNKTVHKLADTLKKEDADLFHLLVR